MLQVLSRVALIAATATLSSGLFQAAVSNLTLTYNLSAFYPVAPHHVSVALSVYAPGSDPSWSNADVLTMALDDPDFAYLSREFTAPNGVKNVPTLLRIGGSYNDAVYITKHQKIRVLLVALEATARKATLQKRRRSADLHSV